MTKKKVTKKRAPAKTVKVAPHKRKIKVKTKAKGDGNKKTTKIVKVKSHKRSK